MHITTACLSVLGSLFVLVTYHLIPTHRGASLRIVYWLSVSDLVTSFVYIVDGGTSANEDGSARCPDGLCVLLASLSQVFNLSAIVWNTYIALNMHLTVLLAARIVKDEPRCMHMLAGCMHMHMHMNAAGLAHARYEYMYMAHAHAGWEGMAGWGCWDGWIRGVAEGYL